MVDVLDGAPVLSCLGATQQTALRGMKARVNILEGAIRSGKTIVSLLRFLIAVVFARGGAIVVVARTRDSAYRNVFAPLMDPALFGRLAFLVSYNSGAPTAKILGRTVHVLGASDAKAEKVLRGLTVALAYVDEVTVIPEEFFTQLLGRMSPPNAQLFGTTNPDSPAHWLKVKFLDRIGTDLVGWVSFHFTLDDNPGLTEQYKLSIKAEFTGLWYKRFVLGEWVAAEGAIFDMWDPDIHTIPWDDLPEMQELIAVGVDYGTTNPTAAIILGISAEHDGYGRPRRRLFFVDEFRHDSKTAQQKLTDAQLSERLRAWLDENHLPPSTGTRLRPRYVILDPSAASFMVQLHSDGVTAAQADNEVLYGIRTVASLLAAGKLLVARPTTQNPDRGCPGFIAEAPGYAWDPEATLKGVDKPIKVADHSLDGGRYSVVTTERIWRSRIDFALAA
ncbi:phage terminase large subunit [Agromyces sp. G08B096]|uniref:Phage terminase large subunit n=1 Tax=Agromyces sp. G08B096 TaxID=3156399 RepID=A0AAU7W3J2_9MICO